VCGPEVVELGKGDAGKTGTASFVCKNKNKTCVAVRSASHRALNNPRAEQIEERKGAEKGIVPAQAKVVIIMHVLSACHHHQSNNTLFCVCLLVLFTLLSCVSPDQTRAAAEAERDTRGRAHACFQIQYLPDQAPRAYVSTPPPYPPRSSHPLCW
jgi:hypothetical protein